MYPLSREEREEVREFVKEQLRKGYIRLSKSPQMAPVFFVGKKDGKKRMVQDYRYLNEWMIKNNYPLPLISDVLENIGTKKLFIRIDLRWGYNNVRIKEGDKWKAAFMTPQGSFEPTVMFFGLTNSPATFQAMINKLLRDLINMGKVAVFIDDVIVGTETEEGHDELVGEVIRRLDVIYKSTCPENYIPVVMPPLNPTSPPSMAATFLATRLMAVLQPSGYSVFHGGDTPIQLSLP